MGSNSESQKRAAATLKKRFGANYFQTLRLKQKPGIKRGEGFKDIDKAKEAQRKSVESRRRNKNANSDV